MSDFKENVSELAELMEEFRLGEASIQRDGLRISFRRRPPARVVSSVEVAPSEAAPHAEEAPEVHEPAEAPKGIPITSPMSGIFYGSPSPNSPAFVKEGDAVTAGQVVGLIEAMKVFNEIPSTVSGIVQKLVAETGAVVQPGDILLYIG